MTTAVSSQQCPVCGRAVHVNPRYPRYACAECVETATTLDGRPVKFVESHQFLYGAGLRLRETGEVLPDPADDPGMQAPNCLVRGERARASEAHMGGIVVELLA